MLLDVTITIMDKLIKELEASEPEKREQFISKALSLVELSTKSLINSSNK